MTLFAFEGFDPGTPVNLAAQQGTDTVAGSVTTWAEQDVGTATIEISASQTTISQYDQVWLHASGWAGFDTPATHSSGVYLPRDHDIVYFWDTGKTGDFSAPQRLIDAHRSRQHAHGPFIAVCYDQPGVYAVRLYAYEPSSGKFGVTTTTITVNSADVEYPGTQTICINPNGDSDFSAAPPGAQVFELSAGNVFSDTHPAWTSNTGGLKKRFLLKGGAQFNLDLDIGNASEITSGWMLGSYGGGNAQVVNTSVRPLNFGGIQFSSPTRILINNLDFIGTFNPDGFSGGPDQLLVLDQNYQVVVHNVVVDGYGSAVYLYLNNSNPTYTAQQLHLDNFTVLNMGGQYPILGSPQTHPDSKVAFTGCRIQRPENSPWVEGDSGSGGALRAPVRLNAHQEVYMQATEIYQNTDEQPCFKLGENRSAGGGRHNLHCNLFESTNGTCLRYESVDSGVNANLLFRQNTLVLGTVQGATNACLIGGQGNSIDSNLIIGLGSQGNEIGRIRAAFRFQKTGSPNNGAPASSPTYFRNNTFVLYRNSTENSGGTGLYEQGGFDVIEADNVEHYIGLNDTADAPLEDGPAGVKLFDSLNTGRWVNGTLDTNFAASPTEIYSFKPEPGSTALGGGSASGFPFPIDAQTENDIRPAGSEDKGCWQETP